MDRSIVALAAAVVLSLVVTGCSSLDAPAAQAPDTTAVSAVPTSLAPNISTAPSTIAPAPSSVAPVGEPDLPADFPARITSAVAAGAARGAMISIAVLDRKSGAYFSSGDSANIATASVAKLFIADEVLFQSLQSNVPVSADDSTEMTQMLESSDDNAADLLWDKYGGSDVVTDVASRYGLAHTTPPYDGSWWNTETDAADLVKYYSGLLDNTGGLTADRSQVIIDALRGSTAAAADGYPQWFGIADALPQEPVRGVKQGWMCCVAGRWVHLSTGVVGTDNRYILVVNSQETVDYDGAPRGNPDTSQTAAVDDASARHARDTMTDIVQILFPQGKID